MAGKSDGSIIIDSKIDTSGFTQSEVNMKSSFGKIASAASKMGAAIKSAFTVKSNGAEDLKEQTQKIEIAVDDTAKSVEDGMQRINDAMSSGANTEAFDTIQDKVDALTDHLKLLAEQGLGFGDAEYDATYQQLVLVKDELKQYKAALAEAARAERDTAEAGQEAAQYVGFLQSTLWGLSQAAHAPISMLQVLGSSIRQLPHATVNLIANGFRKIADFAGQAASQVGKKLLSGIKKLGTSMLGLNKSTKGVGNGFKNLLKYGLGISSLLVLFRKIRSAIKEGMQNLAQYSSKTNSHLSALKSSLTQLKNSLATAFNPILTVITPILTRFIDLLSKAATYVGMFFAALTGKKSFTKAVAVQEDYAASLGKTADNAKEAKKYLSGLDEIRTFTEDRESSQASAGVVDPSQMFEEVEIPSFIKDWVERFKEAWENADFYNLGALIGTKIKNALDKIDWEKIKEIARRLGRSLATFLNGIFETPGLFESLGKVVGELINTAIAGAKEFLSTLNFEKIGQAIADFFNGAMEAIDWEELAKTLSIGIEDALDMAIGFLEEFDWDLFASSIEEFLANVDWEGIFGRLGLLILEVGRAYFKIDSRFGIDLMNAIAEFFRDIGMDSVAGFFEGIAAGIEENRKKIEQGFEIVINWVKEKLGIHSPSTVFAEIGRNLILGFINGITSLFASVKNKFTTLQISIVSTFTNLRTSVSNIWNGIASNIKSSVNSIIGFINSMISGIVSGINALTNTLNGLQIDVPDWVTNLTGVKAFGFNLPTFTAPQIPYLATGAVIPPNAPFAAVLGDQKHGNNIEAPENLLRRIVREEGGGQGFNGTIRVPVIMNGRQIMEAVVDAAKLQQTVSGNNPLAFT